MCQDFASAAPEIKTFVMGGEERASMSWARKFLPPIPESVAALEDAYQAPDSKKTLLLIQDAHTNNSAQLNVAKTLDAIFSGKPGEVEYVFLEAGFGNESLSFLRKYTDLEKRNRIAKKFLYQGKLQGSEYLDVTSEHRFVLWGVEDLDLYAQSVLAYRDVLKEREKFEEYLGKISSTVDALRPRVLNPFLLLFIEKQEKYQKGLIGFTEYFELLQEELKKQNLPMRNYPHLSSLRHLRKLEQQIDFKKASEEEAAALAALTQEERDELGASSKDNLSAAKLSQGEPRFKAAFFRLLEEKISLSGVSYPELTKYFRYLKLSRHLKTQKIINEQKMLEGDIYTALTMNADEEVFLRASRNLELLKKLFHLTLMPDEFKIYEQEKESFDIQAITGFLNKKLMDSKDHYDKAAFLENGYEETIKKCEEFYKLTYDRDRKFIENLNQKMSGASTTTAVLITGGYHTPNLKYLLKSQNISYISLTPQVLHETNQERYERLLLGQIKEVGQAASKPSLAVTSSASHADMTPRIYGAHFAQELGVQLNEWEMRELRSRADGLKTAFSHAGVRFATPAAMPDPVGARLSAEGKMREILDYWRQFDGEPPYHLLKEHYDFLPEMDDTPDYIPLDLTEVSGGTLLDYMVMASSRLDDKPRSATFAEFVLRHLAWNIRLQSLSYFKSGSDKFWQSLRLDKPERYDLFLSSMLLIKTHGHPLSKHITRFMALKEWDSIFQAMSEGDIEFKFWNYLFQPAVYSDKSEIYAVIRFSNAIYSLHLKKNVIDQENYQPSRKAVEYLVRNLFKPDPDFDELLDVLSRKPGFFTFPGRIQSVSNKVRGIAELTGYKGYVLSKPIIKDPFGARLAQRKPHLTMMIGSYGLTVNIIPDGNFIIISLEKENKKRNIYMALPADIPVNQVMNRVIAVLAKVIKMDSAYSYRNYRLWLQNIAKAFDEEWNGASKVLKSFSFLLDADKFSPTSEQYVDYVERIANYRPNVSVPTTSIGMPDSPERTFDSQATALRPILAALWAMARLSMQEDIVDTESLKAYLPRLEEGYRKWFNQNKRVFTFMKYCKAFAVELQSGKPYIVSEELGMKIGVATGKVVFEKISGARLADTAFREPTDFIAYKDSVIHVETIERIRQLSEKGVGVFEPEELIRELERIPFLGKQFGRPTFTPDGYRLDQHTAMAMRQFERYFAGIFGETIPDSVFDLATFRLAMALHDSGKLEALETRSVGEHAYAAEILGETLKKLGYVDPNKIRFAKALINGDPIGTYLAAPNDTSDKRDRVMASIKEMADASGSNLLDFFRVLSVYYQSDASAYTRNAYYIQNQNGALDSKGHLRVYGKENLDGLFEYERLKDVGVPVIFKYNPTTHRFNVLARMVVKSVENDQPKKPEMTPEDIEAGDLHRAAKYSKNGYWMVHTVGGAHEIWQLLLREEPEMYPAISASAIDISGGDFVGTFQGSIILYFETAPKNIILTSPHDLNSGKRQDSRLKLSVAELTRQDHHRNGLPAVLEPAELIVKTKSQSSPSQLTAYNELIIRMSDEFKIKKILLKPEGPEPTDKQKAAIRLAVYRGIDVGILRHESDSTNRNIYYENGDLRRSIESYTKYLRVVLEEAEKYLGKEVMHALGEREVGLNLVYLIGFAALDANHRLLGRYYDYAPWDDLIWVSDYLYNFWSKETHKLQDELRDLHEHTAKFFSNKSLHGDAWIEDVKSLIEQILPGDVDLNRLDKLLAREHVPAAQLRQHLLRELVESYKQSEMDSLSLAKATGVVIGIILSLKYEDLGDAVRAGLANSLYGSHIRSYQDVYATLDEILGIDMDGLRGARLADDTSESQLDSAANNAEAFLKRIYAGTSKALSDEDRERVFQIFDYLKENKKAFDFYYGNEVGTDLYGEINQRLNAAEKAFRNSAALTEEQLEEILMLASIILLYYLYEYTLSTEKTRMDQDEEVAWKIRLGNELVVDIFPDPLMQKIATALHISKYIFSRDAVQGVFVASDEITRRLVSKKLVDDEIIAIIQKIDRALAEPSPPGDRISSLVVDYYRRTAKVLEDLYDGGSPEMLAELMAAIDTNIHRWLMVHPSRQSSLYAWDKQSLLQRMMDSREMSFNPTIVQKGFLSRGLVDSYGNIHRWLTSQGVATNYVRYDFSAGDISTALYLTDGQTIEMNDTLPIENPAIGSLALEAKEAYRIEKLAFGYNKTHWIHVIGSAQTILQWELEALGAKNIHFSALSENRRRLYVDFDWSHSGRPEDMKRRQIIYNQRVFHTTAEHREDLEKSKADVYIIKGAHRRRVDGNIQIPTVISFDAAEPIGEHVRHRILDVISFPKEPLFLKESKNSYANIRLGYIYLKEGAGARLAAHQLRYPGDEIFKNALIKHGASPNEVGKALGIHPITVTRWVKEYGFSQLARELTRVKQKQYSNPIDWDDSGERLPDWFPAGKTVRGRVEAFWREVYQKGSMEAWLVSKKMSLSTIKKFLQAQPKFVLPMEYDVTGKPVKMIYGFRYEGIQDYIKYLKDCGIENLSSLILMPTKNEIKIIGRFVKGEEIESKEINVIYLDARKRPRGKAFKGKQGAYITDILERQGVPIRVPRMPATGELGVKYVRYSYAYLLDTLQIPISQVTAFKFLGENEKNKRIEFHLRTNELEPRDENRLLTIDLDKSFFPKEVRRPKNSKKSKLSLLKLLVIQKNRPQIPQALRSGRSDEEIERLIDRLFIGNEKAVTRLDQEKSTTVATRRKIDRVAIPGPEEDSFVMNGIVFSGINKYREYLSGEGYGDVQNIEFRYLKKERVVQLSAIIRKESGKIWKQKTHKILIEENGLPRYSENRWQIPSLLTVLEKQGHPIGINNIQSDKFIVENMRYTGLENYLAFIGYEVGDVRAYKLFGVAQPRSVQFYNKKKQMIFSFEVGSNNSPLGIEEGVRCIPVAYVLMRQGAISPEEYQVFREYRRTRFTEKVSKTHQARVLNKQIETLELAPAGDGLGDILRAEMSDVGLSEGTVRRVMNALGVSKISQLMTAGKWSFYHLLAAPARRHQMSTHPTGGPRYATQADVQTALRRRVSEGLPINSKFLKRNKKSGGDTALLLAARKFGIILPTVYGNKTIAQSTSLHRRAVMRYEELSESQAEELWKKMKAGDELARLKLAEGLSRFVVEWLESERGLLVDLSRAYEFNEELLGNANEAFLLEMDRADHDPSAWNGAPGTLFDFLGKKIRESIRTARRESNTSKYSNGFLIESLAAPAFSRNFSSGRSSVEERLLVPTQEGVDFVSDFFGLEGMAALEERLDARDRLFLEDEIFVSEEKDLLAKNLNQLLIDKKIPQLLQKILGDSFAIYMAGSMGRFKKAYKNHSDVNLILVSDANISRLGEALYLMQEELGGSVVFQSSAFPTLLVGKNGNYDYDKANGNGFISLLELSRVGNRENGLASIEVASIAPRYTESQMNGYIEALLESDEQAWDGYESFADTESHAKDYDSMRGAKALMRLGAHILESERYYGAGANARLILEGRPGMDQIIQRQIINTFSQYQEEFEEFRTDYFERKILSEGRSYVSSGARLATVEMASVQGRRDDQNDRIAKIDIDIPEVAKHGKGTLLIVADGNAPDKGVGHYVAERLIAYIERGLFASKLKESNGNVSLALSNTYKQLHELIRQDLNQSDLDEPVAKTASTLSLVYLPEDTQKAYVAVLGDSPVFVFDQEEKFQPTHIQNADYALPDHIESAIQKWNQENAEAGAIFIDESRGYKELRIRHIKHLDANGQPQVKYIKLLGLFGQYGFDGIVSREPIISVIDLSRFTNPVHLVVASDGVFKNSETGLVFDSTKRIAAQISQGYSLKDIANAAAAQSGDNVSLIHYTVESQGARLANNDEREGLEGAKEQSFEHALPYKVIYKDPILALMMASVFIGTIFTAVVLSSILAPLFIWNFFSRKNQVLNKSKLDDGGPGSSGARLAADFGARLAFSAERLMIWAKGKIFFAHYRKVARSFVNLAKGPNEAFRMWKLFISLDHTPLWDSSYRTHRQEIIAAFLSGPARDEIMQKTLVINLPKTWEEERIRIQDPGDYLRYVDPPLIEAVRILNEEKGIKTVTSSANISVYLKAADLGLAGIGLDWNQTLLPRNKQILKELDLGVGISGTSYLYLEILDKFKHSHMRPGVIHINGQPVLLIPFDSKTSFADLSRRAVGVAKRFKNQHENGARLTAFVKPEKVAYWERIEQMSFGDLMESVNKISREKYTADEDEAFGKLKSDTMILLNAYHHPELSGKAHAADRNEIRNLIIEKNLGLIPTARSRFARWIPENKFGDWEDDNQVGVFGLIRAIDNFDPSRRVSFSTYALYWIAQSVSREIRSTGSAIRIPTHINDWSNKLNKASKSFKAEHGYWPDEEELAEYLGWSLDKVKSVIEARFLSRVSSLDEHLDSSTKENRKVDLVAQTHFSSPAEAVMHEDESTNNRRRINTIIGNELNPVQALVVKLRRGIGVEDGRKYTLKETGRFLGYSIERIRQLEAEAMTRLKEPQKSYARSYDDADVFLLHSLGIHPSHPYFDDLVELGKAEIKTRLKGYLDKGVSLGALKRQNIAAYLLLLNTEQIEVFVNIDAHKKPYLVGDLQARLRYNLRKLRHSSETRSQASHYVTGEQLGDLIHRSRNYITLLEQGQFQPSLEVVASIVDVFSDNNLIKTSFSADPELSLRENIQNYIFSGESMKEAKHIAAKIYSVSGYNVKPFKNPTTLSDTQFMDQAWEISPRSYAILRLGLRVLRSMAVWTASPNKPLIGEALGLLMKRSRNYINNFENGYSKKDVALVDIHRIIEALLSEDVSIVGIGIDDADRFEKVVNRLFDETLLVRARQILELTQTINKAQKYEPALDWFIVNDLLGSREVADGKNQSSEWKLDGPALHVFIFWLRTILASPDSFPSPIHRYVFMQSSVPSFSSAMNRNKNFFYRLFNGTEPSFSEVHRIISLVADLMIGNLNGNFEEAANLLFKPKSGSADSGARLTSDGLEKDLANTAAREIYESQFGELRAYEARLNFIWPEFKFIPYSVQNLTEGEEYQITASEIIFNQALDVNVAADVFGRAYQEWFEQVMQNNWDERQKDVDGDDIGDGQILRNAMATWEQVLPEDFYKNKRVLELGSGTGIASFASLMLGASEVVGVDSSENSIILALNGARRLELESHLRLLRSSFYDLSNVEGDYDIVQLVDAERFVPNFLRQKLLQEAKKKLSPGGSFFLYSTVVPQYEDVREIIYGWGSLLDSQGFRDIGVYYLGTPYDVHHGFVMIAKYSPENMSEESLGARLADTAHYQVTLTNMGKNVWKAISDRGEFEYEIYPATASTDKRWLEDYLQLTYGLEDDEERMQAWIDSMFGLTEKEKPFINNVLLINKGRVMGGYTYFLPNAANSSPGKLQMITIDSKFRGTGAADILLEDLKRRFLNDGTSQGERFQAGIGRVGRPDLWKTFQGTVDEFRQSVGIKSEVRFGASVQPIWDQPIQRMLASGYEFLPQEVEEEKYVYRGIRGGVIQGLISGSFDHQSDYSPPAGGDFSEKELGIYHVSHYLTEAGYWIESDSAKERSSLRDMGILVMPGSFFNQEISRGRAAVYTGRSKIYRFPFFTKPLQMENIAYILVWPDLKEYLDEIKEGLRPLNEEEMKLQKVLNDNPYKILSLPEFIWEHASLIEYFKQKYGIDFDGGGLSIHSDRYPQSQQTQEAPGARLAKEDQDIKNFNRWLTRNKDKEVSVTVEALARRYKKSISYIYKHIIKNKIETAGMNGKSFASKRFRRYLQGWKKRNPGEKIVPHTAPALAEKFGLTSVGVTYILGVMALEATPGKRGRKPAIGARLAKDKTPEMVTFVARVYDATHQSGELVVGETLLRLQKDADENLLIYFGEKVLATLTPAQYKTRVLNDRTDAKQEVSFSMADFKAVLDGVNSITEKAAVADALDKINAVVEVDVQALNPSLKGFDELILPLLAREINLAHHRHWGENAVFLLEGDNDVVQRLLGQIASLNGEDAELFVFAAEQDLPDGFKEAKRVQLTTPTATLQPGVRHFFIQALAEGDLPNFRAAIRAALVLARVEKLETTDTNFIEIKNFVEKLLGHPIEVAEWVETIQGQNSLFIQKYSLPAITKLSLNALFQGARLTAKMAEQAA